MITIPHMNKSWKTTLAGSVASLGLYLTNQSGTPEWMHSIGQLLQAIGVFSVGAFARDNDKTSEQVKAPDTQATIITEPLTTSKATVVKTPTGNTAFIEKSDVPTTIP